MAVESSSPTSSCPRSRASRGAGGDAFILNRHPAILSLPLGVSLSNHMSEDGSASVVASTPSTLRIHALL